MKIKKILLIEDDRRYKESIERDFKKPIFDKKMGLFIGKIDWTDSVSQALELYNQCYYDLVILDLRLGEGVDKDGIDFLTQTREMDNSTPVLILSGQADEKDHQEIGKYNNTRYFKKAITTTSIGNSRLERFIEMLREGEEYFEKNHRDFFLPPVMVSSLFFQDAAYGNTFQPEAKEDLLKFLRAPLGSFEEKGIIGWFERVEHEVVKSNELICSKILNYSSGRDEQKVDIKTIISRANGGYTLEKMEFFLNMDPYYREHYSHQRQVFLLGCLIYNQFKERVDPCLNDLLDKYIKLENPHERGMVTSLFEVCWYLTAMFHDCGYPIQHYHKLFTQFLKENFHYRFSPRLRITDDLILNERLDPCFDVIADDFWGDRNKKEEFRLMLVHQFVERNHAVHSAVAMRKLIRFNESGESFSRLLQPVYSAIALHDYGVWQHSAIVGKFLKDNQEKLKDKLPFNYNLDFQADLKRNPLLHILLIADSIHHWGRGVGIFNLFSTYRLDLVNIGLESKKNVEFLTFELNAREGEKIEIQPYVFCQFCRTFKTLSVILGSDGLPVKILLNRGLKQKEDDDLTVTFHLGIGENIDCQNTPGCPCLGKTR